MNYKKNAKFLFKIPINKYKNDSPKYVIVIRLTDINLLIVKHISE